MSLGPTERYAAWLVRSQISPALSQTSLSCPGSPLRRGLAAAPPPPPAEPAVQESYLSGTSGSYVEDMYESWCYDPKSVHASWDSYFRSGSYQVRSRIRTLKARIRPFFALIYSKITYEN